MARLDSAHRRRRRAKPPVDEWGAALVHRLRQSGHSRRAIAATIGYSLSTVKRLVRHRLRTGADRVPRPGKGKTHDVRWTFAGPSKDAALAHLQRVKDAGDDADLLKEVHARFVGTGVWGAKYRTLCEALRRHLDYTSKRLGAIPRERDVHASLRWRVRVRLTYAPEQLILIDESACNGRTMMRRTGYSKRGSIAKTNLYFFHKGVNHSVLGPFVIGEGFLDLCIVEGAYDGELFWQALLQVVLPHMRPFPEKHSVLVLDNCPIHHQRRITEKVYEMGGILIYLEPYDPDSMPVEYAFRCMKNFMRHEGPFMTELGFSLRSQLWKAARSVGYKASRHAYHAAGF